MPDLCLQPKIFILQHHYLPHLQFKLLLNVLEVLFLRRRNIEALVVKILLVRFSQRSWFRVSISTDRRGIKWPLTGCAWDFEIKIFLPDEAAGYVLRLFRLYCGFIVFGEALDLEINHFRRLAGPSIFEMRGLFTRESFGVGIRSRLICRRVHYFVVLNGARAESLDFLSQI